MDKTLSLFDTAFVYLSVFLCEKINLFYFVLSHCSVEGLLQERR